MSTARVDFTRGAAERIASVVRRVEQGDRDGAPLAFRRASDLTPGSPLKLAVFSSNWNINEYKTVTFYGVTGTPNTARVLNLTTPSVGFSTANTTEQRFVVFGKVKYTTDPVVVELGAFADTSTCTLQIGSVALTSVFGFDESEIQLLGHNLDGCLQWYSVSTCATAAI